MNFHIKLTKIIKERNHFLMCDLFFGILVHIQWVFLKMKIYIYKKNFYLQQLQVLVIIWKYQ